MLSSKKYCPEMICVTKCNTDWKTQNTYWVFTCVVCMCSIALANDVKCGFTWQNNYPMRL